LYFRFKRYNPLMVGEVTGLAPNSVHGFHVHWKGDCSSADGVSACAHFNPNGKAHGQHEQGEHHGGDLPSLAADAAGTARFEFETRDISLGSGVATIAARGLIVHRDPDDFKTQPTGKSGARVACAVITTG
jgi:Cu-Zn family superoxide dismutase